MLEEALGILHHQNKRLVAAEADFQRALKNGTDPGLVHYHLALLSLTRLELGAALAHLERSVLQWSP